MGFHGFLLVKFHGIPTLNPTTEKPQELVEHGDIPPGSCLNFLATRRMLRWRAVNNSKYECGYHMIFHAY